MQGKNARVHCTQKRPVMRRLSCSMIHRPCLTLRRLALASPARQESKKWAAAHFQIHFFHHHHHHFHHFTTLLDCMQQQRCNNPILKSSKRRSSLSFLSPLSLLFTLNVKIQVCLKKSFIKLQCQSEITHTAANYYFCWNLLLIISRDEGYFEAFEWCSIAIGPNWWLGVNVAFFLNFFKRFVSVCIQQRTRRTWTNLCGWPKKHAS